MIRVQLGDTIQIDNGGGICGDYTVSENAGEYTLNHVTPMCGACEQNDAYNFDDTGVKLCPGCFRRAFAYLMCKRIMDEIGEYDIEIARAVSIMQTYDSEQMAIANARSTQYIETGSWVHDEFAGEHPDEVIARVANIADVIVNAIRGMSSHPGWDVYVNTPMSNIVSHSGHTAHT